MRKFLISNKAIGQAEPSCSSSTSGQNESQNQTEQDQPAPALSVENSSTETSDENETCNEGPPSKKKHYAHKYNSAWEKMDEFKCWIVPSNKGNTYFKCKVCDKHFIGGIAAVKKHGLSKAHTKKLSTLKSQPVLSKSFQNIRDDSIVKKMKLR